MKIYIYLCLCLLLLKVGFTNWYLNVCLMRLFQCFYKNSVWRVYTFSRSTINGFVCDLGENVHEMICLYRSCKIMDGLWPTNQITTMQIWQVNHHLCQHWQSTRLWQTILRLDTWYWYFLSIVLAAVWQSRVNMWDIKQFRFPKGGGFGKMLH